MSRIIGILVALLLLVGGIIVPAVVNAQTEFAKFEENPVLDLGPSGSWDDFNVMHPSVLFEGGVYQMWYTGSRETRSGQVGYATSPDGIAWTKYSGNPVLTPGPPGSWDDGGVGHARVLFDGITYYMWYSGSRGLQETDRIGFATSTDGVNWAKHPGNPVISSAPWASAFNDPYVIVNDGVYWMYFRGFDSVASDCGVSDGLIHWCIGLATSSDGINWNIRPSPILKQGPYSTWDSWNLFRPVVVKDGNTWHMWYTGQPPLSAYSTIGYAWSSDGVSWRKQPGNPVLTGGLGAWDNVAVASGSVIQDASGFRLWYSGTDTIIQQPDHTARYRIGLAKPATAFAWSFDDGNTAGWKPIIGWNSETSRPEHPQDCRTVNGEYSLTTCHSLYRLRNFTDFVFEAHVRLVQAAAEPIWGISFRQNPASAGYADIVAVTGDPYTLAQGYDLEFVGTTLYLFRCEETCTILASASPAIDPSASNRLRVVASGPSIQGFVNDEKVVEISDSTFPSGLIGLFSVPNGCSASGCAPVTSNFDNVKVTPLDRQPGVCSPVSPGLVSWWPGDGNAKDVQDHNDGTLQNGASFGPGMVGEAFSLDGIDDYVLIGNTENLKIASGITIDAWVNPTSPPPLDDSSLSGIYAIVTKWGQSAATDAYGIWLHNPDGNTRLVGGIGVPGVSDGGIRSGGIIPVGEWSHVAMTYDSSTGINRLFVNGVQVGERARFGGITVSDLNMLIGKEDSVLPRFFQGSMDEVEVYDRPLLASEIRTIFEAGSNGKCKAAPSRTLFLLIDEDSIDNGILPNNLTETDVNDHIAEIGLRTQLPFFAANQGSTITLYTGQVGDEGWFALKEVPQSWADAGPTPDGLRNYVGNPSLSFPHNVGPGLGTPDANGDRESLLDKIPRVTPLRATGLKMLEGLRVCAVVYDSNISINYDPLVGSLKGANLGTVAFKVLSVTPLAGFSSSSLPQVDVEILNAEEVCEGPLERFDAPEPVSSSEPGDVNDDLTINIVDLAMVGREFGKVHLDWQRADIDHNGVVNILDLAMVAVQFGQGE